MPRLGNGEPSSSIHFRKRLYASAMRWPFQIEQVASQRERIEIALQGESADDLAAALALGAERHQGSGWLDTCLFVEFPASCSLGRFALIIFAFWNGPRPKISLAPERTARMHKKDMDCGRHLPEHQYACAFLGHLKCSLQPIGPRTGEHSRQAT